MSVRTLLRTIIILAVWAIVFIVLADTLRNQVLPQLKMTKNQLQRQLQDVKIPPLKGGCDHRVMLGADSFAGYAILRSPEVTERLVDESIDLAIVDDHGNYTKRIQRLKDGVFQMGVFSIDTLIQAGGSIDAFPARIVYMISESNGADGIVAKSDEVLTLSDLNREGAKIVVAGNSRSDLLSRVAMDQIDLSGMGANWQLVKKTGLGVLEQMQMDSADAKRAYVLWEPQLSVMMQDAGTHLLADANSLSVRLVDVLVVSTDYLDKAPEVVEAVVKAYAEASRVYQDETKLLGLIKRDVHESGGGSVLEKDDLNRIRASLLWMSLEDNYNAFQGAESATQVQTIGNRLDVIMDLLLETNAVARDPFGDDPSRLVHDQIVKKVYEQRAD